MFTKELSAKSLPFWGERFGYKKGEEQQLFQQMLAKQSNASLQWSLKTLCNWKEKIPKGQRIFQIHGDQDRTFPVKYLKGNFYKIKGGSHMMVYNRSAEISQIIQKELASLSH
ncbi:MAG: hypothetical protein AAF696_39055 [Bacteroidota bacterium]